MARKTAIQSKRVVFTSNAEVVTTNEVNVNHPLTKKAQMIALLSKMAGADTLTLSSEFGWKPHSVRAALTRLRKSGYLIVATKPNDGGGSIYRITATPENIK